MDEIYQSEMKDDYYVANFHTLVGFVVDTYKDLLTSEECDWYAKVSTASESAQRLYIRLLTRKRSVFRISRLNYPEINDLQKAASELAGAALASCQPPANQQLLLSCFTKPELVQLLDLEQLRNLPRVAITDNIMRREPAELAHCQDRLESADKWVSIEGYDSWMLMQLCFFGNLYQDSSEFVLRQLGALQYENYPLDSSTRAFQSREQIEAHWRYFEAAKLFECTDQRSVDDLLKLAATLPTLAVDDSNLERRVDRLRNRIARQLERLGNQEAAATLYKVSKHPPARERRARLMMRDQQWQEASDLVGQILENPYNEPERQVAQRLNAKCCKALGLSQKKQPVFKPASSKLVLSDQGVRVEELARRYYALRGECLHTENTLVNGVLGLCIWDIMFCPLPGAFFNPFQMAPTDFNQPEFTQRRAALLHERLSELTDAGKLSTRVQKAFQEHYGKLNPLVRWHGLTRELLVLAIDRIPGIHWRALFQRILSDPREYTAGFPDLVLFPEQGGYEFIEIKGPGDTLQANQRLWMQYFDKHGIACRLVHIRYRASDPICPPNSISTNK